MHVPAAGTLVENGERLLVHPPGRRGTSRVWRSWPVRDRAEALILETVEEFRASGGGRLAWHTGDAVSPPFMDALLSRWGFGKTEDLEVLAFELGDGPQPRLPRLDPPADVRVDLARDEAGLRAAHAVESRVFPNSSDLVEPEIHAYLGGIEGLEHRKPGPDAAKDGARALRFLAFAQDPTHGDDRPVATAGAEVVGETVRLWGAGTLGEHRRRGAYRALVFGRCRLAHALGATLPRPRRHAGPDQGKRGHLRTPSPKRRVQARGLRTSPRVVDPNTRHPRGPSHQVAAKGHLRFD